MLTGARRTLATQKLSYCYSRHAAVVEDHTLCRTSSTGSPGRLPMRTKTAHRAEELPHGWRGLFDSIWALAYEFRLTMREINSKVRC